MKTEAVYFLENPTVFNIFKNFIGYPKITKSFLSLLDIKNGQQVLDIGCGTCDILNYLPAVKYLGFDQNSNYIKKSHKTFKDRGSFVVSTIEEFSLKSPGSFDVVIAHGVLHHLDDKVAKQLFELAHKALKKNGSLISLDGVKCSTQGLICKLVMSMDRGKYIRRTKEYLKLAHKKFSKTKYQIYKQQLIIPYHHISLKCTK